MNSSTNNNPISPEPDGELIDWKTFDSLLEITSAPEDPDMMRDLLSGYETQVKEALERLAELGPESQVESRQILHKLLGSAGAIAFIAVLENVKKLHDTAIDPPAVERQRILEAIRLSNQQSLTAARTRHPWLLVD